MDYPRDNVFTFLFSTYKRTSGIVFAAIIILAVPLTVLLIGQQQDVRQRAQTPAIIDKAEACGIIADQIELLRQAGRCNENFEDDACRRAKTKYSLLECDMGESACVEKPTFCSTLLGQFISLWTGECLEPTGGWCPKQVSSTQNVLGVSTSCPKVTMGDINCDGQINVDDFNIWREGYLK